MIADTKLFWSERSKGKSYIISGFNQAYTYACDYNEPCAYLVIYKMCNEGLNFLVPASEASFPSLTVNNKTIFFVVVDIFEHGDIGEQTRSDEERGHHGEGTRAECRNRTRASRRISLRFRSRSNDLPRPLLRPRRPYEAYRPTYPDALFAYLASLVPAHDLACAEVTLQR